MAAALCTYIQITISYNIDIVSVAEFQCSYCFALQGGIAEEVDEKVMHAAFVPFGELMDIQIPLDYETGDGFS